MPQRLPEVIVLGSVTLRRTHSAYNKRFENTWVCENNYNELERNRKGQWRFEGSPLSHFWTEGNWYATPEEAYMASLRHQVKLLQTSFEEDVRRIHEEMNNSGADVSRTNEGHVTIIGRRRTDPVPPIAHEGTVTVTQERWRSMREQVLALQRECDRLRAGRFIEGDYVSYGTERKFLSKRGFPLIWSIHEAPIDQCITAEYYQKWYELYVVHPDGSVTSFGYEELEQYTPPGESAYRDHTPNPHAVHHYAEARNWSIDLLFWEMCTGRYYLEGEPAVPPLKNRFP